MKYVWLDIKGDVGIFQALMPIVLKAQAHAKAVGRDVQVYANNNLVTGKNGVNSFRQWTARYYPDCRYLPVDFFGLGFF